MGQLAHGDWKKLAGELRFRNQAFINGQPSWARRRRPSTLSTLPPARC